MKRNGNAILTSPSEFISGTCKVCLFFLLLLTFSVRCMGQDTSNSVNVEQKSYQLYQDKNWNELIKFANKSIHKGFDYFYLQMRLGIAYYEKKNYCLASTHFKKALKFSGGDELALEYLYYCYAFTGRNEDARMLSKTFRKSLSEKIGTNKLSPISFIVVEGGTKISDSAYYYDQSKKAFSNYYNPPVYFQIGLNHYIKNRVSFFHALTLFNQKNFSGTLQQKQYYVKAAIPFKKNWLVSPSFHAINLDFSSQTYIDPSTQQAYKTNNTYYLGSLSIQKTIKKFVFSIGFLASNISDVNQYIHSALISYAPLGNSKIVLGCTGYFHTKNNYTSTNSSFAPFLYLEPLKRVSLKFSYLTNTASNIIEDNGYLVNNSPDLTKSRVGALANFFISKKVSLYALYQLENKQENYQRFNYKYNLLVGGIKIAPSKK